VNPIAVALVLTASLTPSCTTIERIIADTRIPDPESKEIHPDSGTDFDHTMFTEVLERVVDETGRVDYPSLKAAPENLDRYIGLLAGLDFDSLSRDAKLATLINAYNAFTLRLILDYHPIASIKDIPSEHRWQARRWSLGGEIVSLDEIEHQRLRAHFREPRIHFAINCASESCPPLSPKAFQSITLHDQLESAARRVHDPTGRWYNWDASARRAGLFRIYLWFHGDFEAAAGSAEAFAARYHEPLRRALDDATVDIHYLEYDWSLNQAR